jgi:hypothetical protein
MNFEWNHEQIEKLIDLYEQKTELWNPKYNNYHMKKNEKNYAWLQIAGDIVIFLSFFFK